MKHRWAASLAALVAAAGAACADNMVLADKGVCKAPVIVAAPAGAEAALAAEELARCVEKMCGARPSVTTGSPAPPPDSAVWIGRHPALEKAFPGVAFDLRRPEEILIVCNGRHVAILGRDLVVGGTQVEHGTANAVYTFLDKYLGVRRLWPGPLGEDIPQRPTITLPSFEFRFHPPFRQRKLWRGSFAGEQEKQAAAWFKQQRVTLFSYRFAGGHAFTKWWDAYHEQHPDYFARLPNGKRVPQTRPADVKLCVSNPAVWAQWLENAEKAFKDDPALVMVSASPNDGPGFCTCEKCRAWDHPDGPTVMGGVALTDRYVKFWNILARGLRERLTDREAWVGAYAYSAYRTPPIAERLEPNIAVGYVGHFPLAGDATTQAEQEGWKAWAQKASSMIFRPNLFHYSGGFLGLPTVSLRRTIKDFRFLAENRCVGLEVDTLPMNWATQGVQYYLFAQLGYDPLQDGEALLKDYFSRGFGPAAADVEAYFRLMEQAHDAILAQIKHSSAMARQAVSVYTSVYTAELMAEAEMSLHAAKDKAASGPEVFRQRVAFIRTGYDYTALQVRIMNTMAQVRESKGADAAAVQKAIDLCNERDTLLKNSDPFAVRFSRWYHESRRLEDYLGPPSDAMRQAAGVK